MNARYIFHLRSASGRRGLPSKIILGQRVTETAGHVLLKLLAYLIFFRERLQIDPRLDPDEIPFEPDLAQLDYSLRPVLWVECGECSVNRLDRLAVKVPEAAIWVVKRSEAEVAELIPAMAHQKLRRDRYHLLGLDAAMFEEALGSLRSRNEVFWMEAGFDPCRLQFDFNGLWFDAPFRVWKF
ncbi:MAG: YaeQ family protein [Limisphaerales bacterium]